MIIVYQSKYGSTAKYAGWLAEELGCGIVCKKSLNIEMLQKYNTIIYGGALYAGNISGISLITKNWEIIKDKNIAVFTVGLANPLITEQFASVISKNFTNEQKRHIKIFHLRGAINYTKLSIIHKIMLSMHIHSLKKKAENGLDSEEKAMLETYGGVVDFSDRAGIKQITEYIKTSEKWHG